MLQLKMNLIVGVVLNLRVLFYSEETTYMVNFFMTKGVFKDGTYKYFLYWYSITTGHSRPFAR